MEDLEKWITAGDIAREALGKALDLVREGVKLLQLAEELEGYIRRMGAQPAFPVNISVNEIAAHYSPSVDDEAVIPPGAVVKVDVGVHVDGYIADTALTIALSSRHAALVDAARHALREALSTLKAGIRLGEIGSAVERAVRARGFKPISNLSGHSMSRYVLHSGKSVPNVRTSTEERVRVGEVYAIEPFVTEGAGYVVEADYGTIYRVLSVRSTGVRELDSLLRELWRRYRGLPFSERWVYREMGEEGLKGLKRLVKVRRVYLYPVLVEAGRGAVAQFEDTVVITRRGVLNTTRVLDLCRR
ncbi:MAG: type II methionyl aminopeptidase [Thermoprotei archaeon]|nr:MAG: type II methionyl aminopeptidase [Thermoprotei archaeon]